MNSSVATNCWKTAQIHITHENFEVSRWSQMENCSNLKSDQNYIQQDSTGSRSSSLYYKWTQGWPNEPHLIWIGNLLSYCSQNKYSTFENICLKYDHALAFRKKEVVETQTEAY